MMLTDLADVLRDAGLEVIEEPGWKTRTTKDERGKPRQMIDVLGVTCHHTANGGAKGTEPSRAVVRDGRPGLQGPLAHLLLRTDGVFRVIAAGHCNHAGESRSLSMTNSHRIGIEAEAKGVPGTVTDWPEVQVDAYALGCWALSQHYRFDVSQVLGHKETCAPLGRKTDPSFGMTAFRESVKAAGRPKPHPPKQENTDMATSLTPESVNAVARAVWTDVPPLAGQQTAGLLHELDLRSDFGNLKAAAAGGVAPLLTGLATAEEVAAVSLKLDQVIALLQPTTE